MSGVVQFVLRPAEPHPDYVAAILDIVMRAEGVRRPNSFVASGSNFWAMKHGYHHFSWTKRWFELRDMKLIYFKKQGGSPKGELLLDEFTIVHPVEVGEEREANALEIVRVLDGVVAPGLIERPHGIRISVCAADRTYYLHLSSDRERANVLEMIRNNVEYVRSTRIENMIKVLFESTSEFLTPEKRSVLKLALRRRYEPRLSYNSTIPFEIALRAVSTGRIDVIRPMLENHLFDVNDCFVTGSTLVHECAVASTGVAVFKFLAENYRSELNIDAQRVDGDTALIVAARLGREEMVKLLCATGARVDIQNNYGESAISEACSDDIRALLSVHLAAAKGAQISPQERMAAAAATPADVEELTESSCPPVEEGNDMPVVPVETLFLDSDSDTEECPQPVADCIALPGMSPTSGRSSLKERLVSERASDALLLTNQMSDEEQAGRMRTPADPILPPELSAVGSAAPSPTHQSSAATPTAVSSSSSRSNLSSPSSATPTTATTTTTTTDHSPQVKEEHVHVPKVMCMLDRQSSLSLSDDDLRLIALAVPLRFRLCDWMCVFSTADHGFSAQTLFRRTRDMGPSVVVVETESQGTFGAFLSDSIQQGSKYYGSGETFVWRRRWLPPGQQTRSSPDDGAATDAPPAIEVHNWTSGYNSYFILGTDSTLTVGGGRTGWAFRLNSDLLDGTTHPCDTFSSPALTADGSEMFKVHRCHVFAMFRGQDAMHKAFVAKHDKARTEIKFRIMATAPRSST